MRGFADAFDHRRQQHQVDDGEDYYVSSANFPVDGIPFPSVPPSAYFHQQHPHSLLPPPQHPPQLHVMTNQPIQYDSSVYAAAGTHPDRRINNYPEVNLQHHYGGLSPRHFNDSLVPPNLMQPSPMNLYDMPTSPVGHMASPTNRMAAEAVLSPTAQQKVRYNDHMVHQKHHQQSNNPRSSPRKEDRNPENDAEAERYKKIYHQVFAKHSRTPSETRTPTEHTRTEYTRTEHTGRVSQAQTTSRSQSESTSSESSTSISSFSEEIDEDWEENIRSTLNEMAGNLKNLGGIHCHQAGPDSTEVQLKLNLPVPMQYMDHLDSVAKQGLTQLDMAAKKGFNTAVATLSPKKCNMQYGYSHFDEQVYDMEQRVYDMEQRFVGTINELQGNVMPVYKSLFESQSDESSEVEGDELSDENDDDEESTYEDPRFLPKIPKELSAAVSTRRSRSKSRKSHRDIATDAKDTQLISRVPSHIVITDAPSDFSSAESWRLSSTMATPAKPASTNQKRNATEGSRGEIDPVVPDPRLKKGDLGERASLDWIPAVRGKLELIGKDSPPVSDEKEIDIEPRTARKAEPIGIKAQSNEIKPKSKKINVMAEIPQIIDLDLKSDSRDEIVESFSEITTELVDEDSQEPPDPPEFSPDSKLTVRPPPPPPTTPLPVEDEIMNDAAKPDDERSFPLDEKESFPSNDKKSFPLDKKRSLPGDGKRMGLEDEKESSSMNEKRSFPLDEKPVVGIVEEELVQVNPPHQNDAIGSSPIQSKEEKSVTVDPEEDFIPLEKPYDDKSKKEVVITPQAEESGIDELMGPRPAISFIENNVPPGTSVSSPRKSERQTEDSNGWKMPLSPMYLRVMRLRQEKAASIQRDDTLAGETVKNVVHTQESLLPTNQENAPTKESVVDEDMLMDEFLKPKRPDLSFVSLSPKRQMPTPLEETKLDDAINEVFGLEKSDAPDDELPNTASRGGKKIEPESTNNGPDVGDGTPAVHAEKIVLPVISENDEAETNKMEKDGEEEMPEDERVDRREVIASSILEPPPDDEIGRIPSDIPEDELQSVGGPVLLENAVAKTPPSSSKEEHSISASPTDPDSNALLDEPFDFPPKVSNTPNDNNISEMSVCESDQSFRSARQSTISCHSRKDKVKADIREDIPPIEEDLELSNRMTPDTPTPSCEDLMSNSNDLIHPKRAKSIAKDLTSLAEESPEASLGGFESKKLYHPQKVIEEKPVQLAPISDNSTIGKNLNDPIKEDNVGEDAACDYLVAEEDYGDLPLPKKETTSVVNDSIGIEVDGDEIMATDKTSQKNQSNIEKVDEMAGDLVNLSDKIDESMIPTKYDSEKKASKDEVSVVEHGQDAKSEIGSEKEVTQNEVIVMEQNQDGNPEINSKKETTTDQVVAVERGQDETSDIPTTVESELEKPSLTRAHRSRESLYQVQGFAEYCKRVEKSICSPKKETPSSYSDETAMSVEDRDESASSRVQPHYRSLNIEVEDPEESSIDEQTAQIEAAPVREPTEAETSSIDRDVGSSDADSEYSTTNTEGYHEDSVHTHESQIKEKSSIDDGPRASGSFSDRSVSQSSSVEEQSDIDTDSSDSQWSEEKDVLPEMKPTHDLTEHDRHMSATRRFRNQIDIDADEVEIRYLSEHTRNNILSSDATAKTFDTQSRSVLSMDETLQSRFTRVPTLRSHPSKIDGQVSTTKYIRAAYSADTHLTSPLTTSFTMDTPLAAASTISSVRTFDHDSVMSSQQSAVRRRQLHHDGDDNEGYIKPVPSYRTEDFPKASVVIPVRPATSRTTRPKQATLGLFGFADMVCNVALSIFFFVFEWAKYLVVALRGKRRRKIECAPTRLGMRQPDQVLRREEIQDRSMDSFIHRSNGRRPYYLNHYIDQREHVATTMTVTPPILSTRMDDDDEDEVGTCVGSIVPDTHPPTWEVISSPRQQPSKSFGAVRKAYSSLSSVSSTSGWRRNRDDEDINWT